MNGYYRLIASMSSGGGGGSYGALTTDWIAATGESDSTILSALDTLEIDLGSTIISKMKAVYPFVGNDALKHSFNFIDTSLHQISWFGGVVHSSTGVVGNGVNAYGDTNLNLTTDFNQNDNSFGTYIRTSSTNLSYELGALSGSRLEIDAYIGGNLIHSNNSGFTSVSNADSKGFYINTRLSSSNYKVYKNGTQVSSANKTSGASINLNAYLLKLNGAGVSSDKEQSFTFFGDGLTNSEITTIQLAVQTFQTTLGRNV